MPTAQVNGIEIWYETLGPEDGTPILLISGVGTQSTRWKADFVEALIQRGYRAIKMDNRDIGLSQKFTEHGLPNFRQVLADKADGKQPDIPYTLSDMAADGIALLDHLGLEKAHVCGFSMGGMIVQLMAIEHPDKVLSMTSIMSNTGNPDLPRSTEAASAALTRPRPDPVADRDAAIQSRIETDRVIGSPAYPEPEDELRAQAAADLDRSIHPTGFARQYAAILASRDRRAELQKLTMPVSVIHGTDDPLVRVEGGRDTAANCPTAELFEIEGMGHNFPREVYDQILDGIDSAVARAR